MVNPVMGVPAVAFSVADVIVNAGTVSAGSTVIEKFCDVVPTRLRAVIRYVIEDALVVGVPDINPVCASKESPGVFYIDGDIS